MALVVGDRDGNDGFRSGLTLVKCPCLELADTRHSRRQVLVTAPGADLLSPRPREPQWAPTGRCCSAAARWHEPIGT